MKYYRELKKCPNCGASAALREDHGEFLCHSCYSSYPKPQYTRSYDRGDFCEYADSINEADSAKVARAFNELIERIEYLEKKVGIISGDVEIREEEDE